MRPREVEGNASHAGARSTRSVDVRKGGKKRGTNPGHGRRCMSRRRLLLATLGVLCDLRTNPNTLEVLSNRMHGLLSSGRKMGLDYLENNVN